MSRFIKVIEAAIESQTQAKDQTQELILNKIQFQKIQPETKLLLQSFTNLTFITIVNCDLRTLENFPVIPALKEIWLTNNKLQGTLRYLLRLEELEYIDLSNNIIAEVHKLLPLKRLRKVSVCINGNPIEKKQSTKNLIATLGIRIEKEQREQRIRKKQIQQQRIQEKVATQEKQQQQSKQSKEKISNDPHKEIKQVKQIKESALLGNFSKSLVKQYILKKRPYKIEEYPDLKSQSIEQDVPNYPNRQNNEASQNQFNQFAKIKSFEFIQDQEEQDDDEQIDIPYEKNAHQANRLGSESSQPIVKPTYLSVFMNHQKNIFGLESLGQAQGSLNQYYEKDEDQDDEEDEEQQDEENS